MATKGIQITTGKRAPQPRKARPKAKVTTLPPQGTPAMVGLSKLELVQHGRKSAAAQAEAGAELYRRAAKWAAKVGA